MTPIFRMRLSWFLYVFREISYLSFKNQFSWWPVFIDVTIKEMLPFGRAEEPPGTEQMRKGAVSPWENGEQHFSILWDKSPWSHLSRWIRALGTACSLLWIYGGFSMPVEIITCSVSEDAESGDSWGRDVSAFAPGCLLLWGSSGSPTPCLLAWLVGELAPEVINRERS